MGFDLYAVSPNTEQEKHRYFRANVWYWRPLWEFVICICQDELSKEIIEGGHYNEGILINKDTAIMIGNKIKRDLKNNKFDRFKEVYKEVYGSPQCDKKLTEEFADFCLNSGGFKIW